MPYKGVIDPQQLAILNAALDEFCRIAGVEKDTPEHEQAGLLVLSLHRRGATSAEALAAAIENILRREDSIALSG